jgi:hypothetical protein
MNSGPFSFFGEADVKKRWHYHLLARMLVITGVVAALPLAAGFVLIQHSAKTRLSDATGVNFVWFAEHAASSLDVSFLRELEFLSTVARSPVIRTELTAPHTHPPDDLGEALADRSLSRRLADLEASNPIYRGILVLDLLGSPVGASLPPERFDYGSEASFAKALARARSARDSDASWAEPRIEASEIALYRPVRDPDSGEVLGLVLGALDTERLFASVSGLRFGESGHACLFERKSGLLLAGSRALCAADGRYRRLDDYRRADGQGRVTFLAGVEGPGSYDRPDSDAVLVAFAHPELARTFPELDWVVTVEQSLAESNAPLAPLSRDLVLYFLGMGALVVVLAAYLSYRLEKPATDVRVHLHPS